MQQSGEARPYGHDRVHTSRQSVAERLDEGLGSAQAPADELVRTDADGLVGKVPSSSETGGSGSILPSSSSAWGSLGRRTADGSRAHRRHDAGRQRGLGVHEIDRTVPTARKVCAGTSETRSNQNSNGTRRRASNNDALQESVAVKRFKMSWNVPERRHDDFDYFSFEPFKSGTPSVANNGCSLWRDDANSLMLPLAASVLCCTFFKLRVQTVLLTLCNSKVKNRSRSVSRRTCKLLDLCKAAPHRHRLMKLYTGFNLKRGAKLAAYPHTKRRSVKKNANRPEHHAKISDSDHMINGHMLWNMRSVAILAQVLRKGVPWTSWA